MAVVSTIVLNRIREKLIHIQHPEVRLWQDHDLITAIFENSSQWFELLKWFLITFDESLSSVLNNAEQSSMIQSLHDIVLSLGLLQTSEEVQKCVSGKFTIEEREGFCNSLISAIELERKHSQEDLDETNIQAKTPEKVSFEEYRSFGKISKEKKGKNSVTYDTVLELYEVDKGFLSHLEETLEETKLEYMFQAKDGNLTSFQHVENLNVKRKDKYNELLREYSAAEELWKSVTDMHKSELEPLLPVNIDEARKMPELKQLSKNIDCLRQHQETLQIIEDSIAVLQDQGTIGREFKWSVKNTESLPVNDCFKQIYSVKTQIQDLKSNNTSVKLNDTIVKLNDTSIKSNNTSVQSNSTFVKLHRTGFI